MRLPDVPLDPERGRWLRDELGAPAPLLLLFPGTGRHRRDVQGVADIFRKAHETLRVTVISDANNIGHSLLRLSCPCAVLVRPTGRLLRWSTRSVTNSTRKYGI